MREWGRAADHWVFVCVCVCVCIRVHVCVRAQTAFPFMCGAACALACTVWMRGECMPLNLSRMCVRKCVGVCACAVRALTLLSGARSA